MRSKTLVKIPWKNILLRVILTLIHYSDIVSDRLSGSIWKYIWHLYGICILTFHLTFFPTYNLDILSWAGDIRRPPQHPEVAIWCSGPGVPRSIWSWQKQEAKKVDEEEGGERGEEEEGRGVVPLSESRYPHLAGGEIESSFRKTINTLVVGRNFGILMAFLQQKEKCWNMLNPKGRIASICSSIFWTSMSSTFFDFGRTGLPQYSFSYGGIGCKNCYYLYLCSGRNSRNFSQHTILFWHCLL